MNRKDRRAAEKNSVPASPQTANMLAAGFGHHQAGRTADAERLYRDVLKTEPRNVSALHLLGVAAQQSGRSEDAIALIGKAIAVDPKIPECHYNLGSVFQSVGRLAEAAQHYVKAIALKSDYAEAHFDLGNVLARQDRFSDAETSYRRALALNPGNPAMLTNLGMALREQNKLDDAIDVWREAVRLQPDFHLAHMNIGLALKTRGDNAGAATSLRRALHLKPDSAEAMENLANLLLAQRQYVEALALTQKALALKEKDELKTLFVLCVTAMRSFPDPDSVYKLLLRAMAETWAAPAELAQICTGFIKGNGAIKDCIDRAVNNWPKRLPAQNLFGLTGLLALAQDKLFRMLLESTPVVDIETERFLTALRTTMLDAAQAATVPSDAVLAVYCALARQCFINQYVFACPDAELAAAIALREALAAKLADGTDVPALWVAAVAAYAPLHEVPGIDALLTKPWPQPLDDLLTQQVREPREEQDIRSTIPAVATSEKASVDHAYPRWTKIAPVAKAKTIDRMMTQAFPQSGFRPLGASQPLQVLIAGCGTGQTAIVASQIYKDARILAVDAKLSDLSYAIRKSRAAGLRSIDYAHADIGALSSLERQFDVIDASGLLHRLDDPFAGWRALLPLLRPGGVMQLGFTSEQALRDMAAAQRFIAGKHYPATDTDIRRARQDIMELGESDPARAAMRFSDFFAMGECRDLLFQPAKGRVTLPQIGTFLRDNGLVLLGFDLAAGIRAQYAERFPADTPQTDLNCWHQFEADNTDTFVRMVRFWIQKAA